MKIRFMALSLIALFAAEAFANNQFIPNYYRNRRALNEFSAVGWSDRKEAGVGYSIENSDVKKGGTKTSKDMESTIDALVFYRTPANVNIEAGIAKIDGEKKAVPANTKDKDNNMGYNLGLGYELTEMPVAFAVTLGAMNNETKNAAGVTSKEDKMNIGLGVGYRMNDVYFGFGYKNAKTKVKNTKDAVVDSYTLGVGKVYGDRANPMAATEVGLTFYQEEHVAYYVLAARGLYNTEMIQYYAGLNVGTASGNIDWMTYGLTAGLDYKFMDFYVGPQIMWSTSERTEANADKNTSNTLVPALEAGYRIPFFEAALGYNMDGNTAEYTPSATTGGSKTKTETNGNTLYAKLTYFF